MNVMIVRLGGIGDAILALPVAAAVRKSFPGSRITMLCGERAGPVFEQHPDVQIVKTATGHERLRELIEGHVQGLSRLYHLCATPKRVVDVFPALFKSEIGDENLLFATGESRAHLHYLTAHGVLAEEIGPDGASRFVQAGPFDPTRLKELAA